MKDRHEPKFPRIVFELANVSSMLTEAFRSDGLHAVYTGPDGVRLSVKTKGGKITGWVGTDAHGNTLPTTVEARSRKAGDKLPTPGDPGDMTCWVCITTTGGMYCYEIPCKF